jgi:hypothetical protein
LLTMTVQEESNVVECSASFSYQGYPPGNILYNASAAHITFG